MPRKRKWSKTLIAELLEEKYTQYACPDFIEEDPIQLPKQFTTRHDQEVIGFLAATIAWGQRVTIIRNGARIVSLMDSAPYDFVMGASEKELDTLYSFVHRTFNGDDLITFVQAIRNLYTTYGNMEKAFFEGEHLDMAGTISRFKQRFFQIDHAQRTTKHVADPLKGSSAKRINMYMRWMARRNDMGIDLGVWDEGLIPKLHVPLDVHSGNTARVLGLLKRKQNDWKAVIELTESLRELDAKDPIRFDIPLFAIGVYEPELLTG